MSEQRANSTIAWGVYGICWVLVASLMILGGCAPAGEPAEMLPEARTVGEFPGGEAYVLTVNGADYLVIKYLGHGVAVCRVMQ